MDKQDKNMILTFVSIGLFAWILFSPSLFDDVFLTLILLLIAIIVVVIGRVI